MNMNSKHNPKLTEQARMLRKNMTKQEKQLWYRFLRTYRPRFLRQKVIDYYIVDFYCHDARLVIELDGAEHYTEEGKSKDVIRTGIIEARNLKVIRIPNSMIDENFTEICEYIDSIVKKAMQRG